MSSLKQMGALFGVAPTLPSPARAASPTPPASPDAAATAAAPSPSGACCAPPPAPAAASAAKPASCCAPKPTPPASCCAPKPTPPAPALPQALDALGPLPQYRHAFVEGCTCGSGVMGCCPCTMGLAEHGALRAGAHASAGWHGPTMVGAGALGVVGLALGVRAMTTNAEAGRRVARALAHNDERLLTLQARTFVLPNDAAEARQAAGRQQRAVQRRGDALRASHAERRFNFWVPGALQVLGSAFMALAAVQHLTHHLAKAPAFGALATGVLAGYAGLYAVRAVTRAHAAWRAFRASRAQAELLPQQPFVRAVADRARLQLWQRLATAGAWTALAGSSAAVVALPLLGASVGPVLGAVVAASQLGAVAASLVWPAPVHTPSAPRLDEAFATGALTDVRLRDQWLASAQGQVALVEAAAATLLAGDDLTARRRRLAHRLEPWTTPQCGPEAFATVAQNFADHLAGGHAWPVAVDRAVAGYLDRERDWLDAAYAAQQARTDAIAAEHGRFADAPEAERDALAATRAEAEATLRQLTRRRAAVTELASCWHGFAQGGATAGNGWLARQEAMLHTAAAVGLLAEVAGPWVARRPAWFYAAPSPQRLAFGHVMLRPEAAPALAEALGAQLPYAFVRCLLNPNRLVAEVDEALAGGADVAQAPGGLAWPAQPAPSADVCAVGAAADAGFGGSCSNCRA